MSKNRHKHQHNQQPTSHHEQPSCHESIKLPPVYPVRIETGAEDDKRYAEEKQYRSSQLSIGKWLNRITAAGTLIALAGLLYLYGTLKVTDISARATRQQVIDFEAVEAARLIVNVTPVLNPGVLKATVESDSILIDWDVKVTNVGATIARGLNFSGNIFQVANTNGGYVEPPGHPFANVVPEPSAFGPALGQNSSEDFPFSRQILGWPEVADRKSSIIIYMQISYIDIFNRAQAVPDCLYYDLGTKGFVTCPFNIRIIGTTQKQSNKE